MHLPEHDVDYLDSRVNYLDAKTAVAFPSLAYLAAFLWPTLFLSVSPCGTNHGRNRTIQRTGGRPSCVSMANSARTSKLMSCISVRPAEMQVDVFRRAMHPA